MEKGYSVSTELPTGYSPDFDYFLFGQEKHLMLQSPHCIHFYLLKKASQKIMAQVVFHIADEVARSPLRAPFGSFLFSDCLSPQTLYEFIQQVERLLGKMGTTVINIAEPPLYYRKNGDLLHTIFINLGYRISIAELSSGIRIDRLSFEEKIETWEKRKLRQAKQKGLVFKMLPLENLAEVYHLILKSREQRSYSLSMTLPELESTVKAFKNEFVLSGTMLDSELVAGSIAIRVHQEILYNFYSGHLKKYDAVSPMVTLIGGLYRYCGHHKVHLLDLGTSALHGQPNFSLLEFKLRLGAVPSSKYTFEKSLA